MKNAISSGRHADGQGAQRLRIAVALACVAMAIPLAGNAAFLTWDGGGADDNWSTAANWSLDQPAASGDLLTFAGSIRLTPNNDLAGISIQSLTFNSGAGSFTLDGASFTLFSSSASFTPFLQNGSANAQLVTNAITLGKASTIGSFGGALTLTGAIANGGFLLTVPGSGATTFNGVISGAGGLAKEGTGTLLLTGANAYGGSTTITQGTLRLGAGNVLPNISAVSVSGLATLDIGTFSDTVGAVTLSGGTISGTTGVLTGSSYIATQGTIAAILGGTAGLTKSGTGTVNLNSANLYTGATTISQGILSLGGAERIANSSALVVHGTLSLNGFTETAASLAGTGTVALGLGGSLSIAGTDSTSFSGVITGIGGLTKAGSGVLTLAGSGVNLYSGATTVDGGTLRMGGFERIPTGSALVVNAGGVFDLAGNVQTVASLSGSGAVSLGTGLLTVQPGSTTSTTFSGVISGSGSFALRKQGAGSLTLAGANTYTGTTQIEAGALRLGASNVFADAAQLVVTGGTFDVAFFSDTVGQVQLIDGSLAGTGGVLTASSFELQNGTVSARLGGPGSVAKVGAGTVTLSGLNSYAGSTVIGQGILRAGASNVIPNGSNLNVQANSVFDLNGFSDTVAGLSADGEVRLGSGVLGVGAGNASSIFGGRITGSGGITKIGTGSLQLSGSNDYSGATTLAAGTLELVNGLSSAGAAIDVAPGAQLLAKGVVNRPLTGGGLVRATGTLLVGAVAGSTGFDFDGTLDVGSNLVQIAGAGTSKLGGSAMLAAGGRLTSLDQAAGLQLETGATLTATGAARIDGAFQNSGVVNGPSGGGLALTFTDDVSGAGSFTGHVLFSDNFSPGTSPAEVSFEHFAVDGSANVDIELAGLLQGTEYDFINISGLAELDGTLNVHLLDGFLPDLGDSFEILRWGTRSGEFASMFGLDLGPDLFLQPHYTSTSLLLVAATAPIPEPETWAMMLAGLGLMGFLARRRRRGPG